MTVAIEVKDLKFSYTKDQNILDIEELKIQKGEKVFIHGRSGSGKSTLLNLMAAVTIPSSGSINILE